ncbi:hypothetical protein Cni_G09533 [Canna indica]|uniref:Uncharacterized protein n=1 Tax=Canna indica TaxID=4628 RepID=A0AAQ3K2I2_9LILI|nr:hypothetical protein Cni_G09533 [Canna indica]
MKKEVLARWWEAHENGRAESVLRPAIDDVRPSSFLEHRGRAIGQSVEATLFLGCLITWWCGRRRPRGRASQGGGGGGERQCRSQRKEKTEKRQQDGSPYPWESLSLI